MASIGMNLAPVTYYGTDEPFIDRMKTAGTWTTVVNYAATGPTPIDADGNPITAPTTLDYHNYVATIIQVDDPAKGTEPHYVLTYEGTAKLGLSGATILSSTPGHIVFTVKPGAPRVDIQLQLLTMDPNDPIHDMHVVRADQIDLFNAGEIFNPAFVAKASQWSVLRFMDWGNTNVSGAVTWETRSHLSDQSWATDAHATGIPLEAMVQLANEAHTDIWYNVPTRADNTYVTNAMTYIRDNLDPALKLHVEYSNEVWNSGFAAFGYAQATANALWAVDSNGNGTIDAGEAVAGGTGLYYGYRAAQIAAIAHGVFGAASDDRLEMVLAGQQSNIAVASNELTGIARANAGSVASLFDDYAITTYFGSELGSSVAADVAIVKGWAESGAAGLDAAFHELQYGGSLSSNFSLATITRYFTQAETFAQTNGLDLVAYEGAASFTSQHFSSSIRTEMTTFFGEIMNDPRMGGLYTAMADAFAAAGGDTLVAFNDVGTNNQYGYYGVLDSIYDTSSPRYDALAAAQQAYIAEGPSTGTGAPGTGMAAVTVINGTSGADRLYGSADNDIINGADGNDYIDGGAGADQMAGGAGNDTYIVDNAGDIVTENADGGADTVDTMLLSYSLGDNVENLTFLGVAGAFTGIGNDLANKFHAETATNVTLSGGGGNDSLNGSAGDDHLDGGTGADQMGGGRGNDIYIVDNSGDFVSEAIGAGTDEVDTALVSYALSANVENLVYTGTVGFIGRGNALNNVIAGGPGADTLIGNGGSDVLFGGSGNDRLTGGGASALIGGTGDDSYWVTDPGDNVFESAGEGYDTLYSTISYSVPVNVEELLLSIAGDAHANDQGDKITGSSGDDHLYGGLGSDTLLGGNGSDFLYSGGGHDVMTGGAGADTFVFLPGELAATVLDTTQILDFYTSQGDKIDLSAIDANSTTAADDPFTFISTNAFSSYAGELRIVRDGSNWDLFGDTNGDGVADFELVVTSKTGMLATSDFML